MPNIDDPKYKGLVHTVFEDIEHLAGASPLNFDDIEAAIASGKALTPAQTALWWKAQGILLENGDDDQQARLDQLRQEYLIYSSLTAPTRAAEPALIHPLFAAETPSTDRRTLTLIAFDVRGVQLTADRDFNFSSNETTITTSGTDFEIVFQSKEVIGFLQGGKFWVVVNPDEQFDEAETTSLFSTVVDNAVIMGRWANTLLGRSVLEELGFLDMRATVFDRLRFEMEGAHPDLDFLAPGRFFNGLGVDLMESENWSFLFEKQNDGKPLRLSRNVPRDKLEIIFRNIRTIAETTKRYGIIIEQGDWLTLSFNRATGEVVLDVETEPVILDAPLLRRALQTADGLIRHETQVYFPNVSAIATNDPGTIRAQNTLQEIIDFFQRLIRPNPPDDDAVAESSLSEFERYIDFMDMREKLPLTQADRAIILDIFRYYNQQLRSEGIFNFVSVALYPLLIGTPRSHWLNTAKEFINEAALKLTKGSDIDNFWVEASLDMWSTIRDTNGSNRNGPSGSGSAEGGKGFDNGMGGMGSSPIGQASPMSNASYEMENADREYGCVDGQGSLYPAEYPTENSAAAAAQWSGIVYMETFRAAEVVRIAP